MGPDQRDEKEDNGKGKVERYNDKGSYYDGKRGEEVIRKYHHVDRYCGDKVEKVRREKYRSSGKLDDDRNHDKRERSRGLDRTANEPEYKRRKTDGNDRHLHSAKGVASQLQDRRGNDRPANATRHSSLNETKDSLKRKRSTDPEDKWYRRQCVQKSSRVDKQSQDSRRTGGSTSKKWQGPSEGGESYSPVNSSEESVSMTDIEKSTEFEDRIINRRMRFISKDFEDEMQASTGAYHIDRCRLR